MARTHYCRSEANTDRIALVPVANCGYLSANRKTMSENQTAFQVGKQVVCIDGFGFFESPWPFPLEGCVYVVQQIDGDKIQVSELGDAWWPSHTFAKVNPEDIYTIEIRYPE